MNQQSSAQRKQLHGRNKEHSQSPVGAFLDSVREKAEQAQYERVKLAVKSRRDNEKWLRGRGLGGAFDDMTLKDFQNMREKHPQRYRLAVEEAAFRQRELALRQELEEAMTAVKAAGSQAVLEAGQRLPREVELAEKHHTELVQFTARYNGEIPRHARSQLEALRERHVQEVQRLRSEEESSAE